MAIASYRVSLRTAIPSPFHKLEEPTDHEFVCSGLMLCFACFCPYIIERVFVKKVAGEISGKDRRDWCSANVGRWVNGVVDSLFW